MNASQISAASLGLLTAVVASLAGANSIDTLKQPSNAPRTPTELCEEVAHELNQQYVEGMISQERAKQIIDRCFRIYVK